MKSKSRSWSQSFGRNPQYPFLFLIKSGDKIQMSEFRTIGIWYYSKKTETVSAKVKKFENQKKVKLDFETVSIFQDLLLGSHCCFDLSGGLQGWQDVKVIIICKVTVIIRVIIFKAIVIAIAQILSSSVCRNSGKAEWGKKCCSNPDSPVIKTIEF